MPTCWRVMLSHLWDQAKYEHDFLLQPEVRRLAQSKGRCRMKLCPQKGDIISFVYKGKIVMRGECESNGFEVGTAHQTHSCNIGDNRPHSDPQEFAWVIITVVGLSEDIRKTGQRTWAKMPVPVSSV